MSKEMTVTPLQALEEKKDWSTALANSSLLPQAYQKAPANLLLAAEYADTLGVPRMTALTGIHIIKGKPSISADLMASLVRRAGHRLRVSGDDQSATATLIRSDDPDYTYEATWNLDRAKRAGLLASSTWKSYPEALLRARAITEVCRMGASEVLFGAIYAPEELGATVDEAGDPLHVEPVAVEEPAASPDAVEEVKALADQLGLTDDQVAATAKFCGHTGTGDWSAYTVAGMAAYLASRLADQVEEEYVDAEIVDEAGDSR